MDGTNFLANPDEPPKHTPFPSFPQVSPRCPANRSILKRYQSQQRPLCRSAMFQLYLAAPSRPHRPVLTPPSCPAAKRGKLSVSSATEASLSLLIHFRVIYKQVHHPPKGCTNPRADRCCQSPSKLLSPAGTAFGSKGIVWSPQSPELCLSGATGDGRVKKVKQVQAQSLWRVGVICYPARTDTFPSDMARQMGGHSRNTGNQERLRRRHLDKQTWKTTCQMVLESPVQLGWF